jgi:hypothetical protein
MILSFQNEYRTDVDSRVMLKDGHHRATTPMLVSVVTAPAAQRWISGKPIQSLQQSPLIHAIP